MSPELIDHGYPPGQAHSEKVYIFLPQYPIKTCASVGQFWSNLAEPLIHRTYMPIKNVCEKSLRYVKF